MTEEQILILLRLAGEQAYIAGMEGATAATAELGVATEEAGLAMDRTRRRGFLMNQTIFTMRRLIYASSLALIGAGIVATKWGFQFNSAMQSARVALQPVAGEIGGVQKELDYLFNFTKYTPFQFKDVTIAFRQMYLGMRTIGISADLVNQTLKSITDALAATGRTTPGALNRVAVALQHMAYQGHLTGQVVLQLARDGLPIYAALQKELGLTGDQIHNIGRLAIPSQLALQALNKYIETTPGLMNAAYRQATQTLHGQFTTFKDNLSQLMGEVEQGFFHRFQKNITNANQWFNNLTSQLHGAHSMTDVISAIDPAFVPVWKQLSEDIHLVWVAITSVISALITSKPLWALVYAGLLLLHGVLALVVPLFQLLGPALYVLVPLFVAYKAAVMLSAFYTGALAFAEAALFAETKTLTFGQFLLALMMGRYQLAAKAATVWSYIYEAALYALVFAQTALASAIEWVTVRMLAFGIMLELNPIILIITAVALLAAGLVILYFKWKAFHDLVNRTWDWIVQHKGIVAAAIGAAFAPLYVVYQLLIHIRDIWRGLGSVFHWAFGGGGNGPALTNSQKGLPAKGNSLTGGQFDYALKNNFIPHMATGGRVMLPGLSWVGENGPELLHLPAGATVSPMRAGFANQAAQGRHGSGTLKIQVMVSRKVLGEVIAEEWALQQARQ